MDNELVEEIIDLSIGLPYLALKVTYGMLVKCRQVFRENEIERKTLAKEDLIEYDDNYSYYREAVDYLQQANRSLSKTKELILSGINDEVSKLNLFVEKQDPIQLDASPGYGLVLTNNAVKKFIDLERKKEGKEKLKVKSHTISYHLKSFSRSEGENKESSEGGEYFLQFLENKGVKRSSRYNFLPVMYHYFNKFVYLRYEKPVLYKLPKQDTQNEIKIDWIGPQK